MTSATVGNYRLVDKLGEGGMGAVYKGLDLMVEREVAIKMLRPEIARQPEIVERFRAEAVALAKLNHPNIATLYSFFREGDEYFMVMEFVTGQTLEAIIRGSPLLPIEQVVGISSQVLDAIGHAHTYGILHRDIKPANIMLTASGQVKVTDFGIARVLGTARMTREGCVCGTLEYLAPERIRGQEADIRSDLYSMGVVLYEMLSRHLPFERASTYELMRAHLEETPPSFATLGLSSIPAELELVVGKALAKLPEDRFGTVAEFRSALTGAVSRPGIEPLRLAAAPAKLTLSSPLELLESAADAEPSPVTPVPTTARHWKLYAAAAVVLVLLGLMLAWSWNGMDRPVGAKGPAPAPAITQPNPPAMQPQAESELGTAPASTPSPQPDVQKDKKNAPTAAKKQPAKTSTPESERRKAALEALDKGDSTNSAKKPEKETDRRSSALKALND